MKARQKSRWMLGFAAPAVAGVLGLLLGQAASGGPKPLKVGDPVIWDGGAAGDLFGGEESLCCDLNRDGLPELIVGARAADPNDVTNAGSVYVYNGKDGSLLKRLNGTVTDGNFGLAVTCADVDRDKYPDLVIGAPNQNRVFVYSGKTWGLIHQIEAQPDTVQMGVSVAAADVDRDKYPDIIAGAPNYELLGDGTGSVQVFSGKDGSFLHRFDGLTSGDQFGYSLAAGDVDRDRYADIIVGTPRAKPDGKVDAGTATVFSGKTWEVLRTIKGPAPGDHLGVSVGAADLNLDRYMDVVAGAFGADPEGVMDAGSIFVHSGRDNAVLRRLNGVREADHLGYSVDCAPLDGDLYPEIVSGGIQEALVFPDRTENLWVYSGKTGAVLHHFEVPAVGDVFGISVRAWASAKKKVASRIVVGAPNADPDDKIDAGQVYVFPVTR